jgi:polygalacturonase
MYKYKILTSIAVLLFLAPTLSAKDYQASLFGIKSDGVTLNTRSIQRAIDFISEQGGGQLVFYVGRYLTGSIELKSNVTIRIEEGAALVSVPSVYDFKGIDGRTALIYADKQENIGIEGKGMIEGNAGEIIANVNEQIQKGHIKGDKSAYIPSLLYFKDCKTVKVGQLILQNAGNTSIVLKSCNDLNIADISVNNQTTGAKAVLFSGCVGLEMSSCFFNTTVSPFESTGNSQDLHFTKCITPDGKTVSVNN